MDNNHTTFSNSCSHYTHHLGGTSKFIPIQMPLHILWLPQACSATMPTFHLLPHYENLALEVNISLDMANLNMVNISPDNFWVCQHLEKHQNESQLQCLASIPSVPVGQLYSHVAKGIQHITPFTEESTGDTDSIWTPFSYSSLCNGYRITYTSRVRDLLLCCYFFWCQPARLANQPLQPGTMQYTIVDDDVEAAPIYRCDGKASQPTRPCENHGLHIENIPTWMESLI